MKRPITRLYTGCMGAGKSTLLIKHYKEITKHGLQTATVMTPKGGEVSNRSGETLPALACTPENYKKVKTNYILIDEYQFLDVKMIMDLLVCTKCEIRMYGLRFWSTLNECGNYYLCDKAGVQLHHLDMQCEQKHCNNSADYNVLMDKNNQVHTSALLPNGQLNRYENEKPIPKSQFCSVCIDCYKRMPKDTD